MRHVKFARFLVGTVVAVGFVALNQGQLYAFGHSSSSGSSGSSSSGSSGSSSSGSSGSWGSHSSGSSGGWRHHRRHHSSGSWGSHSSSSGSHSSSSGSHGGGWVPSGPPAGGPPPAPEALPAEGTSASFSVRVPAEAIVYVNGARTTSMGESRTYVSRGLERGRSYTFQVRVQFERDGEQLTESKTLRLAAGSRGELAFDFNSDEQIADKEVETKLTLNVPSDAKVFLAGRETSTTGEVREFATTKLPAGSEWSDYAIRVTVDRNGRTLEREQTIRLKAGAEQSLSFDFPQTEVADKVASATR